MRRTPAATPLSATIAKNPMSPVAPTCVPPHSSRLKPGTLTTRTVSPYFSPKSAIAPAAIASCVERTSVCTGVLRQICSLTIRSISSSSSRVTALEVHEVEPQAVGRHERAGLLDVRAEHLAQRRVEQVRGRVVAPRGVADVGVDFGGHDVADASAPEVTRTRCARGRPGWIRTRPSTVADPAPASLKMRPESDTWPPASR